MFVSTFLQISGHSLCDWQNATRCRAALWKRQTSRNQARSTRKPNLGALLGISLLSARHDELSTRLRRVTRFSQSNPTLGTKSNGSRCEPYHRDRIHSRSSRLARIAMFGPISDCNYSSIPSVLGSTALPVDGTSAPLVLRSPWVLPVRRNAPNVRRKCDAGGEIDRETPTNLPPMETHTSESSTDDEEPDGKRTVRQQ